MTKMTNMLPASKSGLVFFENSTGADATQSLGKPLQVSRRAVASDKQGLFRKPAAASKQRTRVVKF
jgi:hypothetical protein